MYYLKKDFLTEIHNCLYFSTAFDEKLVANKNIELLKNQLFGAQGRPRAAQGRPRAPQEGPKSAQAAHKRAPRAPLGPLLAPPWGGRGLKSASFFFGVRPRWRQPFTVFGG